MTLPHRPRDAGRRNAFKAGLPGKPTVADLIARVASVPGMDAADLNYPDHFEGYAPAELGRVLADNGIALNGVAMRYYTDPGFRLGAFSNPDPVVRRAAVDITLRGLDALAAMGGRVMTLWMGQDGVDYSFQGDYARMWEDTSAQLAGRYSRILGVHLNDGYGKRDDGLMVGSVHPMQTLELFVELDRQGFDGVIYFDTFPDHGGLDPVAEAGVNVMMADRLRSIARGLSGDAELAAAMARQDAAAALRLVAARLYRD